MKYRKKLVAVEAVQFSGDNFDEVTEFLGGHADGDTHQWDAHTPDGLTITTMLGKYHVSPNDWILWSEGDGFRPCGPAFFSATYVPVDEEGTVE